MSYWYSPVNYTPFSLNNNFTSITLNATEWLARNQLFRETTMTVGYVAMALGFAVGFIFGVLYGINYYKGKSRDDPDEP